MYVSYQHSEIYQFTNNTTCSFICTKVVKNALVGIKREKFIQLSNLMQRSMMQNKCGMF